MLKHCEDKKADVSRQRTTSENRSPKGEPHQDSTETQREGHQDGRGSET